MIKATELRIGNLILYKGKEIVVTMIGQFGIQSKTKDVIINAKFRTLDLTPIELAEQHLIDFGFKREIWLGDTVLWEYGTHYERFTLRETEQGYVNDSDRLIPYVHLLQNAYFFDQLDGSELTLKTLTT